MSGNILSSPRVQEWTPLDQSLHLSYLKALPSASYFLIFENNVTDEAILIDESLKHCLVG